MSEPALTSEVVVAGAGTGKTHALVNAYLLALLGLDGSGEPRSPARLLAITFTDKAASQMRRRVALRLQALVRDPHADEAVAEALAAGRGEVPDARVLERMLRQLPAAPISTFHALCANLLRDLSLAAGLDPGFTILDATGERELLEETAQAIVLDELARGDVDVAELAARWSLKTLGFAGGLVDALVEAHGQLAERGLRAADVPPAVHTEDAERRLEAAKGSATDALRELHQVTRSSPEATRGKVNVAAHAYKVVLDQLSARDPDAEQELAHAFVRARNNVDRVRGPQQVRLAQEHASAALKALGSAIVDSVSAPHGLAVCRLLVELERRAAVEKDQRGVLGFGDLLLRARDLLRDEPSARARVKSRWDRVLVDEFQDTSPVQADLVALLAEEPSLGDVVPPGEPAMGWLKLAPGRLFIVGDPKQSIYGFRGADVRVFARTRDVVTEGTDRVDSSGSERPLSVSWRSRSPILEVVNRVAEETLPGGDYGVTVRPEDRLQPRRGGEGPAGEIWTPARSDELEPDEAEPVVLARRLKEVLDAGLEVEDAAGASRPAQPGDVAVLVRRIKAAAPIARALTHVGIPSLITGGEGFFRRPEVMDLIAALQLVVEPEDELATLTVLRSPLVALADDDIVRLTEGIEDYSKGLPFAPLPDAAVAAGLDAGPRDRLVAFASLLARLRSALHTLSAAQMVDALIDEGGYALALGVERDAALRLANVEKLRALCEGRPGDALGRIARLWAWLDDPPQEGLGDTVDPDARAVHIMTIHQAKGLEFPIVVVADLGSARPTMMRSIELDAERGLAVDHRGRPAAACVWRLGAVPDPPAVVRVRERRWAAEDAELARLLYVALTRARDHLFLVGEERESGKPSLRRLLKRARARDGRAFAQLLPSVKVAPDAGPAVALPVTRLPDAPRRPPPAQAGPLRLAPSALVEPVPDDAPALVRGGTPAAGGVRARRRGRLAHELIARAGELLGASALPDEGAVTRALLAICRAVGEAPDDAAVRAIAERAARTVDGPLRQLVQAGYGLSFEEPVRLLLSDQAVLIGAADVVARGPAGVVVVELKSSDKAARSTRTAVQLAAYAHALAADTPGDVLVAAWTIGDAAPPAPAPVDEEAAERLEEALLPPLEGDD
jgi:ATP-dependent exoDNAse (exonuclease V) beta subunit